MELTSEINLLDYYLNKTIGLLDNSIKYESDNNIKPKLQEVMDIRQELYELSSIIDGYSIEIAYVGELADQHGIKILSNKDYDNVPYSIKSGRLNNHDK